MESQLLMGDGLRRNAYESRLKLPLKIAFKKLATVSFNTWMSRY